MFNFFASANARREDLYYISDSNHNHIKNVLRMKEGDTFLVCENGISNLCEIISIDENTTVAKITEENYHNTELPIKIFLFQGLPKSDKIELIIQKSVELGVFAIIPTEMNRCVVKIEEKKKKNKLERWQAISESAAKQSKRTIIPEIMNIMTYNQALSFAEKLDLILLPYESKNGMRDTKEALNMIKPGMSIGIFIGPEGGFDDKEAEAAKTRGARIISLGKRILRTETAAISSVAMCMLHAEMTIES